MKSHNPTPGPTKHADTVRRCAAMLRGWGDEVAMVGKDPEVNAFTDDEMASLRRDLARTADTLHDVAVALEKESALRDALRRIVAWHDAGMGPFSFDEARALLASLEGGGGK